MECRKPRVVYANGATWCSRYKFELALSLSSNDYICGSPITPPDHVLHGKNFHSLGDEL